MVSMLVAAALAGCAGDADTRADEDAAASHDSIPERAATVQDTLMIEGMPEVATATLFRTPDGFPLQFSTYVPEGIEVEILDDGAAPAVNFRAAFAGVREDRAYMHVAAYAPGADVRTARDQIAGFLSMQPANDDPLDVDDIADTWDAVQPPGWALEEYAFEYQWDPGTSYVGRVTLARHGQTLFHVIIHYPAEYGDGLGPRLDAILDDWRWEDTGRMLRGNAAYRVRVRNPRPAADGS